MGTEAPGTCPGNRPNPRLFRPIYLTTMMIAFPTSDERTSNTFTEDVASQSALPQEAHPALPVSSPTPLGQDGLYNTERDQGSEKTTNLNVGSITGRCTRRASERLGDHHHQVPSEMLPRTSLHRRAQVSVHVDVHFQS